MGVLNKIFLLFALFLCISANIPKNNLSKGLIVYVPIDEGAGNNAFDLTKNTNSSGVLRITTCTWGQSPLGKSLNWASANTNHINVGKPSCLNLTSSPMTVSAWIYVTNLSAGVNSGYRYIFSDYNANATEAQFAFLVTSAPAISFFWATASTQTPNPTTGQGATTLVVNKLYHVVGTRSGVSGSWTTNVYLNGKRDGGATTTGNPTTQSSAGNAKIGQAGDYNGALGMVGWIKGLRVYNRALTAEEVKQLYTEEYTKIIYGR